MNLIQENTKDVKWYTSLRDVEKWMGIHLEDFDWHFSDNAGGWAGFDDNDPLWMTGKELKLRIQEFDYQFVWSVISAFPAGTTPRLCKEPYADGNPNFWRGAPQKQLKNSLFEIVCWDSSATLWIGLPDDIGERVLRNAPGVKNLDLLNKSSGS